MEDNALEVSRLGVADEVLDGFGCLRWEEPHMDIAKGGVDGGGRGEGGGERFCEGIGGGDGLDFACRALVENIAVARFVISEELTWIDVQLDMHT